jgi:hypothetical protein
VFFHRVFFALFSSSSRKKQHFSFADLELTAFFKLQYLFGPSAILNGNENQGDQIGRIFAQWLIVYSRHFF